MSHIDLDQWLPIASKIKKTENPLRVPYHIGLEEAVLAAAFLEKYWEPKAPLPGLKRIKVRLPLALKEEILSLVRAVQEAQTRLLMIVDPAVIQYGERARFILEELEAALTFLLDDGIEESADEQLAQVKEFHSQDGQRSLVLAQALKDFIALCRTLQDRLVGVDEEFDVSLLDEGEALIPQLQERPLEKLTDSAPAQEARTQRNQLLVLLTQKVQQVRSAAAYVFRRHPEIIREVTSAYERKRRQAAYQAAKARQAEEQKKAPKNPNVNLVEKKAEAK